MGIFNSLDILIFIDAVDVISMVSNSPFLLQSHVVGLASRLVGFVAMRLVAELRPTILELRLSLFLLSGQLELVAHLKLLI